MRTLILMRHGKAVRDHEAESDEARGLTDRGRSDAAEAGRRIAALGAKPDVALVSTARRTRETIAAAAPGFGDAPLVFAPHLYMADAEVIWEQFAARPEETVLIVGHNPGMQDLASMLVSQAHDGSRLGRDVLGGFPTSAFAIFRIDGDVLHAAAPTLIGGWRPDR